MALNDAFADGQADAGSRMFAAVVQTLEDDEDLLLVLRIDTNAVVRDAEVPECLIFFGADMDRRRRICPEPDGIADQILNSSVNCMDRR